MNFSLVLSIVAALSVGGLAHADDVDDYIQKQLVERHIPGISLGIIQNGKIVKEQGYGLANVELKVSASADTVYEIGSITKQFTSCLVMMFVEEGKVALSDPISKHLTGLPDAWNAITVHQLLTHTSGIKGYTELPNFAKIMIQPATHGDVINSVAKLPLEFKPGEKWQYCNTGYFLLGMMLEKISGKSYLELLDTRIFKPLGMSSTRINDPSELIPNRACGYQYNGTELRNADYISMDWPFSAGVLLSTIGDLAKWDAALAAGKLLKASSWKQIWSPVKLNDGSLHPYGFGWALEKLNGHVNYAHGGGIPGFTTYISRFPDDGLTVILLCNQMVDTAAIANHVAAIYVPALAPPVVAAIEDKEPSVTAKVKAIVEMAADGKVDASLFIAELAATMTADLKKGGSAGLKALGPIQSIVLLERKEENGNRSYRYRVEYMRVKLVTVCIFNKENKISGMTLQAE